MGIIYFLLVTASLLSSYNANAAILGDDQTRMYTVASTDAAALVRVVDTRNVKRLLRINHEGEDDEEEIVNNPWETKRYNSKNGELSGLRKMNLLFKEGKTPAQVWYKLSGLGAGMIQKNGMKFNLFFLQSITLCIPATLASEDEVLAISHSLNIT